MKRVKAILIKSILTAICCFSVIFGAFGSAAAISHGGIIFADTEETLIDNIASVTGTEWEQWYHVREKNWDTLTNLLCNCVFDVDIDSITLEIYCEENIDVCKIQAILKRVSDFWGNSGKQFKVGFCQNTASKPCQ